MLEYKYTKSTLVQRYQLTPEHTPHTHTQSTHTKCTVIYRSVVCLVCNIHT